MNAERERLEQQRIGKSNWRLWGPYLSERAWGTVREDYSAYGTAWEFFSHDQARSRAFRWSEDGLGGISDEQQRLCFAVSLWNGRDPILKERAFGVTGNQGNHGEDVKECYFYLDGTPSHSRLHYLYKYPISEFPYQRLLDENASRSRLQPPFSLIDSGAFSDSRYWDVDIEYAKRGVDELHIRITASNRSPEAATLHLLPSLWFRNTWDWGDEFAKPSLRATSDGADGWCVQAQHATLGEYFLYGKSSSAELLFTENETNNERLWGVPNTSPYVKDAFHRRVVNGETGATNPARTGTKCSAWYRLPVAPGESAQLDFVLSAQTLRKPFSSTNKLFKLSAAEADEYFADTFVDVSLEDRAIARQACAGMIWSKQFFNYDVHRWLSGDLLTPPESRRGGRNAHWQHLNAHDVILMPDAWEYPWFASWDLSFHCIAYAPIDIDFAKQQLELLLTHNYMHPNGQIPAYEWAFGDTNPPVQAAAALKLFRLEREQRGRGDLTFLKRLFHKLLLNYTWWLNREDPDGNNVFAGGFLGLDNISVFDRSHPLPPGYMLEQADATGWMAMFALNLTAIALELATQDADFEDIAIQTWQQFVYIANAIGGHANNRPSLWDPEAGFFKDLMITPDGAQRRIDVFSWVGLVPLFACELIEERLLLAVPAFRKLLESRLGGMLDGNVIMACPMTPNRVCDHLLSLVDGALLARILSRVLNEAEFLSPHGIRSVSRYHEDHHDLGQIPGVGPGFIDYEPGESNSSLFGGNSNWRGPVWMPTNFMLVEALAKFQRYLGDDYLIPLSDHPDGGMTLGQIGTLLRQRLIGLFRRDVSGMKPCMAPGSPYQSDPHWRELHLFHEYFHGETGLGLGAAHQTGWTALVIDLILQGGIVPLDRRPEARNQK